MPRHVAFLRGVSPVNLQMADLKAALEGAGFTGVRTVLSSGNVVFDSPGVDDAALQAAVEAAIARHVGKAFPALLRSAASLATLLRTDPFAGCGLPAQAKRVVSFLRPGAAARLPLPHTEGTATVIRQVGTEAFTAYLPGPDGPVFMKLIEQAYGREVTTRTWDTVARCARA